MSPNNDHRRESRWVGTRMFVSADATLERAAADTSPSSNIQAQGEYTVNVVPRPRSRTFGVRDIPALGLERLDGVAGFESRPPRRLSHSAHHQAPNLQPLRAGTQEAGLAIQSSAAMEAPYTMKKPFPHDGQRPTGMVSPRRASTGDWRDRQNPAHPFAFPQAFAGSHQLQHSPKSTRSNFGLEDIVEGERTSYASALKSAQTPMESVPYMGRSRHSNSVEWRPVDWSAQPGWRVLGTSEQVANPRNKPLLSVETAMTFENPQSSSSSGSPHSGRRSDLGGFKPSRMKEEQRGFVAAPTGSNYLGNKQSRRQAPRNKDDPNEDNCALWLTNLPPDLTLRGFLALVNTGEVFAVVFSQPKPPTWTQAVKLVFKTNEAASQFLNQVKSNQGIVVSGMRTEGTWNRNWYPEDRSTKTRVLQIEGPASEMTWKGWHDFFDECVVYQIEEELELPCDTPGKRTFEFRFARVDGQSEALYQAISKNNSRFGGYRYRYGADPCDPSSGLR